MLFFLPVSLPAPKETGGKDHPPVTPPALIGKPFCLTNISTSVILNVRHKEVLKMKNKEITIKLDKETYSELKDVCLALKNVNVFGTKYKTISDEEIGALIGLTLKQKEMQKSLQSIKEVINNGRK